LNKTHHRSNHVLASRIFSLILIYLICNTSFSHAQNKTLVTPIYHQKIKTKQDLSQGRVNDMLQDERGFMWFATMDGLNRYDGYEIKIYKHNDKTNSLSNNNINRIIEDKLGNIWIATKNGLNKMDPYSDSFSFISYPDDYQGSNNIVSITVDTNNNIWCCTPEALFFISDGNLIMEEKQLFTSSLIFYDLIIDQSNYLWLGSLNSELIRYDISTNQWETFPIFTKGSTRYDGFIRGFHLADNGTLWFVMLINQTKTDRTGAFYINTKNPQKVKRFDKFNNKNHLTVYSEALGNLTSITTRGNELWISSFAAGIIKFDLETMDIEIYRDFSAFDLNKEESVRNILLDKDQNLWIGTNGNGVSVLPFDNQALHLVSRKRNKGFKISSIRSFSEDNTYYWIGGYYGISKMNKKTKEISHLITNFQAYSLNNFPPDTNYLLVSVENDALWLIHKETRAYKRYLAYPYQKYTSSRSTVYCTLMEGDSVCWLGTGDGLAKIIFEKDTTIFYANKNAQSLNGKIYSLFRDNKKRLWVGSALNGLGYFNDSLQEVVKYHHPKEDKLMFHGLKINHIIQTKDHVYWLATSSGLLRMTSDSLRFFDEDDNFNNSYIYAVLEGRNGFLWMSTNDGLISFNPHTSMVKLYTVSDGLQDKEFNTQAYYKAKDGLLFFGGIKGLNYFYPNEINTNVEEIPILLSAVTFYNEEVYLCNQNDKELIVPTDVEFFSVKFAGLKMANSQAIIYKYRIKELGDKWINLGKKHEISFHKLKSGDYHLEILAAYNGHWNKQSLKMKIIVEAQFWEQFWFPYILALLIIFILLFISYERYNRLKTKKIAIQRQVEERTFDLQIANNKLKKANETKSQFFSIISHDLRNPIQATQSISFELNKNFKNYNTEEQRNLIRIMNSSMNHMSSLLENLLTWSRVQQNMIKVQKTELDPRKIIEAALKPLAQNIKQKQIHLNISIQDTLQIIADKNQMELIIRNLVSNAIKFTQEGGQIDILVYKRKEEIVVEVADNGIGMDKQTVKNLFIPGKITSSLGTNNEQGTGMGLILIQDFVELNQGRISVKSEKDKGSTFFVCFP